MVYRMLRVLKWLGRSTIFGVIWIFVLSIHWKNEPIFNPMSDFFVKNALVSSVDRELADFIRRVQTAVKVAWADPSQTAKESLE
jgi:hypothetical protein